MLRVNADGKIAQLPVKMLSRSEIVHIVNGTFEFVWPKATPELMMIVNEDGHGQDLPLNAVASQIYGYAPYIARDAIVATRAEYNLFIRRPDDPPAPDVEPERAKQLMLTIINGTFLKTV